MMAAIATVTALLMALFLAVRALRWRRFSFRDKLLMIAAWVVIIVALATTLQYSGVMPS